MWNLGDSRAKSNHVWILFASPSCLTEIPDSCFNMLQHHRPNLDYKSHAMKLKYQPRKTLLVRLALRSAITCPFLSLISCTRLPVLAYLATASASADTFHELHQQVALRFWWPNRKVSQSCGLCLAIHGIRMNESVACLVRLHANGNNQRLPDFLRFLALSWMKFSPTAILDALWFTLLHSAAWCLNTQYLVLDSSQVCRSCPSNLCNIACIRSSVFILDRICFNLVVIATKWLTSNLQTTISLRFALITFGHKSNKISIWLWQYYPDAAWNYGGKMESNWNYDHISVSIYCR